MKELITSTLCVCCISVAAFASDGCVTVKQNGTYVVGDHKGESPVKSSVIIDKGVTGAQDLKSLPRTQVMLLR